MNAENFITINGRQLTFNPGETILDVAKRNDIFIPTLCHLPGARPTGACRICVVEVEGARTLMAACTLPVTPKMVVHTDTPEVLRARRAVMQLMLGSGNHNCSVRCEEEGHWTTVQQTAREYDQSDELCEVYGACKLQALAYRYQVKTGALAGRAAEYPLEDASPLIVRDFSRCILCGRCVQACNDIQVNNAISHGFRGAKAKIIAMGNLALDRSDCVFCGACIQACPVGALVEKRSRYQIRPWEARHVRTTCGYCSVGCQLDLQIKDGRIQRAAAVLGAQPNDGQICAKGRFGFDFRQSADRLTQPQIRKDGRLQAASWDAALDLVAGKIKAVREQHGADAVAGVISARATNESLYAFQKLLRAAVGTHNVTAPFASAPLSGSLADLDDADCILLIGCDVTQENPIAGSAIMRTANGGCRLIVADSQATRIAGHAGTFLQITDGSEALLVGALTHQLLTRDSREGSIESAKISAAKQLIADFDPAQAAQAMSVGREVLEQVAAQIDTAERAVLVYGPRVAAWAPAFRSLWDLLGKSASVAPLGELCNSQGAELMGADPRFLPGYRDATDGAELAAAWNATLSSSPGALLPEVLTRAAGGNPPIKLLYAAGEDLALIQPVIDGAPQAIQKADFLVVQDSLVSESLAHADVVLPELSWGEEDGTYTSCERRISRVRQAAQPLGEARSAVWIFAELARRLGAAWPAADPQAIWDEEIVRHVPQVAGLTYARLEDGGLQWALSDGRRPPFVKPQWQHFNYHHRRLIEHCPALLESLALAARPADELPENDPAEIRRKFEEFLREEEATDKQPEIDRILATYRPQRGGLIPVLQQVQGILGFLPVPVQNYIALGLGLSAAGVFGVVSFYSFFTMIPRGRWTIRLCLGTACYVKQSGRILEKVEQHINITCGETTDDREYSLEGVRCVGACGLAPVVVIGEDTHGQVDPNKIGELLDQYRSMPS